MVAPEGLREMEGSALRRLVGREEASGGRCLLLDCRPFLAHSAGHIRGALNVRCNTIVRRRAKGAVSLEQILPAEGEVRARLRAGLYTAVVLYDERSPRAEALRDDSTVALVLRALRRDMARADIRLLAGKWGGRGGKRGSAPGAGAEIPRGRGRPTSACGSVPGAECALCRVPSPRGGPRRTPVILQRESVLRVRVGVRRNSFFRRAVLQWHGLPGEVVRSPSLDACRKCGDVALRVSEHGGDGLRVGLDDLSHLSNLNDSVLSRSSHGRL